MGRLLIGKGSRVFNGFTIIGKRNISIGNRFGAGKGLWIEAIDQYNNQRFHQAINIGTNVSIGEYVHIGCVNSISIGDNVLMGSKIYITDHNHGRYSGLDIDAPSLPPSKRVLTEGNAVRICDNVWVGEFVTILPGVTVGAGSIIGSHTTVTHDVPPASIVVGSPAKVIKTYNYVEKTWENINKKDD